MKPGLWFPNNRLTCMQGQKTLSFSYNMHLFLPYFLNNSQTIHSAIHFSKALLCVTLICCDWSIGLLYHLVSRVILIKQCLWVQCCFVYSVTGETAIFTAPKVAPTSVRQYANVSCWHHMKPLVISFENNSFQWFRVDSFFRKTLTLYTVHFQI